MFTHLGNTNPSAGHAPLYDMVVTSEGVRFSPTCADGHALVMELVQQLGLVDRMRPTFTKTGNADRGFLMGMPGEAAADSILMQRSAAAHRMSWPASPPAPARQPQAAPVVERSSPASPNTVVIPASVSTQTSASMTLGALRDLHLSNLSRGPKRATPATRDRSYALNLLIETVGDRPIDTLTSDDATKVADLLACWPNRRNRYRQLDGLEAPAVAARAKREKLPPISLGTQHKHLMHINALMNWAIKKEQITENPFQFIDTARYTRDERGKKGKKKDIFHHADLANIFDAKRVAGYTAPHKFWVPLIAYRTGMRVNEIAQLHVDDVRTDLYVDEAGQERQVVTFDITNEREGQSVKTCNAIRRVPVPQQLFDLGFDRYLEDVRASGATHVFPGLPWNEGGPGRTVSQWVNEIVLRKVCGITSRRKTLHCFRHTLNTLMEREKIAPSIRCAINGHTTGGDVENENYVADATVLEMRRVLDSLPFPEITMAPYISERFNSYLAHAAAEVQREARAKAEGVAFKRTMGPKPKSKSAVVADHGDHRLALPKAALPRTD